jgi:hypothetical protein
MRLAGHVAYRVLVEKTEGKRSLGRRRHRWEDNIKTHLKETGWEGVDCIHLVQGWNISWALVNMLMNLQFP